ncbi:glycosyltransferase family 4 protein [Dyella japonica]|uniref:Glycosyltransferase involved in cell wall biosynthesis n=1 Tax=Dyella japonica TaxID=231455 RepID=A0ABV2JY48_9GAMM
MKLMLDMQGAQCQSRHRGIGRYSLDLARALALAATDYCDLHFSFNAQLDEATDTIISKLHPHAGARKRLMFASLNDVCVQTADNHIRRRVAEQLMCHALMQSHSDVVWFSSMIEGYGDDAVIPETGLDGIRTVATLYDLIPLHDPQAYLGHPRVKAWYDAKLRALEQCDLLLSISDWVRQDAIDRLGIEPHRIVSIGGGVDSRFAPRTDRQELAERIRAACGVSGPYVLYNGGFDPRKNVPALIQAYAGLPAALRDSHPLVIVGKISTEQLAGMQSAIHRMRLAPSSVIFTGFVSDEALVDLYCGCALFVFPSTMEGFGLPPLEAMACGVPVIASNVTSLPEVIGNAEATFDPTNTHAITALMELVLTNPARAEALRRHGLQQAAKFSWKAVATRALQAVEALVRQPLPVQAPALPGIVKPKLLWLKSGSTPTWLNQLETYFELTVDSMPLDAWRLTSTLEEQLHRSDRIVYTAGAQDAVSATALARRWPGAVWMDVPLEASQIPGLPALRYELAGFAACADASLALPLFDEGCLGIFLATDSPLPKAVSATVRTAQIGAGITADAVANQLDSWFATSSEGCEAKLLGELAAPSSTLDDDEIARISDAVVRARPASKVTQWLVDVTQITRHDIGTGVQRVVRSILERWLRDPPAGVRVEPVAFVEGHFRYARSYALRLLGLDPSLLSDDFVQVMPGDQYIGLDWSAESIATVERLLRDWHRRGVGMHFVVHDLLPISLPEAFHPFARNLFVGWLQQACSIADGLHCVSAATATQLRQWLDRNPLPYQFGERPEVGSFHLGVDAIAIAEPLAPPTGLSDAMSKRRTLLMVGTLEPRKGHAQALDAIERLWAEGRDINLVIVGRVGWMVEALVRRLEKHEERDQRLFWLDNADDGLLESVYRSATALLAPSLGEGYGLPLIEAAHRGLPVLARDIPVFREVVGDYADYFNASSPEELATAITDWLNSPPGRRKSAPWPTWDQSGAALAGLIRGV